MRRDRARFLPLAAISAATALGLAACGTSTASTSLTATSGKPITVGISAAADRCLQADGQRHQERLRAVGQRREP